MILWMTDMAGESALVSGLYWVKFVDEVAGLRNRNYFLSGPRAPSRFFPVAARGHQIDLGFYSHRRTFAIYCCIGLETFVDSGLLL